MIDKIKKIMQLNNGITLRKLIINNEQIFILYIQQLTNRKVLSECIIRPILENKAIKDVTAQHLGSSIICIDDLSFDDDDNKILDYILSGKCVIILAYDNKYIIANTLKIEKRTTSSPEIEYDIRGPKDCFTENIDSNLSLIRYRLKDPGLKVDRFIIGKRSKSNIALLYIDELANRKYVNTIKNRLMDIDIDGVIESSYIQRLIADNKSTIFPQCGVTERPDTACASILEGRIIIITEGSNFVLVSPKTFIEFLDSPDDHYDNAYISIFKKFIRVLCILITLTLSSLYVAVVGFNTDILPTPYIISIAASRTTVPFNAILEALLMEGVSEILIEASTRLPKQIGSAIGIVGTIVIGQAAVSAGLVSPLMVIIVALTTLCSFAAPDFTIVSPLRLLKFLLIFLAGIWGFLGFIIGFTLIEINMLSIESFGVPYVSPIAPLNFHDLKNYLLSSVLFSKTRPQILKSRDKTRKGNK